MDHPLQHDVQKEMVADTTGRDLQPPPHLPTVLHAILLGFCFGLVFLCNFLSGDKVFKE